MKKTTQLLAGMFIIFFSTTNQFAEAQWRSKASGFSSPQRGIVELIAVGNSVAWGIANDAVDPTNVALREFTRTTDGGNHWKAGSINAFPGFTLVGIAPVSAALCYGSIANFNNGNAKILKTTNGGLTWTEQLNYDFGASFGFFADIYFFNSKDGLVYGDQSNGYTTIFTTHDGGHHWTRVPQANMPAALPDEASYVFSSEGSGNTFWTVSSSGRIWKTVDKGSHWAAYQTGETLIDFSNLKMRDALHGLWGVRDELYRTSDGGVTWSEVEPSGSWFTNDLAYVPGTISTYVSTGSHDFSTYGALHGTGTSYSLDDGNTWITIDTAVEHLSLAMVNSYTGYTGGLNLNAHKGGMFKYNGSALGYSCGDNLTSMCHRGNTICVANGSIEDHLQCGDNLGACCSTNRIITGKTEPLNIETAKQLNVYPNPFSNSATISFSLLQPGKISIKVFDLSGSLIKTLANSGIGAGVHQITWDARNEAGSKVTPGMYLLQFATGNKTEIIKLAIIR